MTQVTRRVPPVWLLGLGYIPNGVIGGILLIAMPQLLAADRVPEPVIANIEALGLIAFVISFGIAPLLDWRFSRRAYAIGFTTLGAACAFVAIVSLPNIAIMAAMIFIGGLAIALATAAVGGWFGNLVGDDQKTRLGTAFSVLNIGTGGLTVIVALPLYRALPAPWNAASVSALILLGLPLFLLTPCPPADGRMARESFAAFGRDVLSLLRRREVLWAMLIFGAPSASFALTNVLGGLGHDYGASEHYVSLVGGTGAVIAGIVGSLLVPPLARRIPPPLLYLCIGLVGAGFSVAMALSPRVPAVFGLAMMGENVFQAAAFASGYAIMLRASAPGNPLASTQYGLLSAVTTLPLVYMQSIDGQAYGAAGVVGSYLADAGISATACVILLVVLTRHRVSLVRPA